jgi:microcystin-dependent protein
MPVGRVISVYKSRLACTVTTTVTTGATVVPVDAAVVDFDEEGGSFEHQPTGNVYSYDSADIDAETITLSAALPAGRTLAVDEALYVSPRADDYYADVAIDDVGTDVVSARVPQMLRSILPEGHGAGQVLRVEAGGEEWHATELVGEQPELDSGSFYSGDIKPTGRTVAGSGTLVDGSWLRCDGTAVSRAVYASLFNAIGTTFGNGNGSTTFNIPDLRGRAPFGIGTAVSLGQNEGKAEATRGPIHVHSITAGGAHGHGFVQADLNQAANTTAGGAQNRLTSPGIHDHNFSNAADHAHGGDTGGSSAGSTDPFSYLGINFLIKI